MFTKSLKTMLVLLTVGGTGFGLARSAQAGISVTSTIVPLLSDSFTDPLIAANYVGVRISANVTLGSAYITAWDLATDDPIHGQLGLTGSFHQAWYPGRIQSTPTPTEPFPIPTQ